MTFYHDAEMQISALSNKRMHATANSAALIEGLAVSALNARRVMPDVRQLLNLMRDKIKFILLTAIILALSCGLVSCIGRLGKVMEKWETSNKTFKVRVTEYQEKYPIVLPHYYHVFESAVEGSNDWEGIMTVRIDDPGGIPQEQVQFVNDQIGYVYMGQIYAVTLDGGRTWSDWNAKENYDDVYLKEVQIKADGVGAMRFHPIPSEQREVRELHTKDYGQSWNL